MKPYDHKKIEPKWQKKWDKEKAFAAIDSSKKPKWYSLIEFPYPSGDGLHVGHIRSNTAMDIISRKRRREGYNVLYPIGWDAFGLPTENYAIKTGIQPALVTKKNTAIFRRQLKSLGFSFDWSREINTTDPKYYKWTQWIFLQFLKSGLAYKKKMAINWCPKDLIGLANEEVIDGKCERCGTPVERREKEQWMLAITKYADRLDKDLDLVDYLPEIKAQQRNWIGKSEGAEISFLLKSKPCKVLLIHGFEGNPDSCFSPWLKTELQKLGYEVHAPSLPNSDHPNFEEMMAVLEKEIAGFGENDMVIGHSMGGHLALKIAEGRKLGKIILIAPAIGGFGIPYKEWKEREPESDYDSLESVLEGHKPDFLKIDTREKIALFGIDDPYVPIFHAAKLDHSWKVSKIDGTGHFEDKKYPEILQATIPSIKVFTTRPDTLFGVTYLVLAPEHALVRELLSSIKNRSEALIYITRTKKESDISRTDATREKTGVELKGVKAINPVNGEEVPVYIADYVLADYGTGAVMAVPAHDDRDFAFAKKYNLPIKEVIMPTIVDHVNPPRADKPSKLRANVHAIVFDPKQKKYLIIRNDKHGWDTVVIGGIEANEDPIEAAKREVREETGYTDIEFKKKLGSPVRAEYFAKHKDENRIAIATGLYFELKSDARVPITDENGEGNQILWIEPADFVPGKMVNSELPLWLARLHSEEDIAFTGEGLLIDSGSFNDKKSAEI
ncbi:MAG: alpha/beta fold hydrolase, partial [Candidatus Pacebacteria bacterium]|nr:alpha/beta fold hydrolase [Candidatus Paceibacterota bacterium]